MNFLLSKSNILILVMQIFLGFSMYNSVNNNSQNITNQISEQEKVAFNQMFLMYQGNQSGSVVKSLISNINTSNTTNEHQVKIYLNDSTETSTDDIVPTQKYNIYFHYDNDGYIDAVRINTVQ